MLRAISLLAFWFWQQNRLAAAPATTATVTTAPSAPPANPIEDEQLRQARAAEAEENYRDAIQRYESWMAANPQTPEAVALNARVALLKRVQGLLAIAELGLKQKDYAAARRDFAEALKLRRESKRAQAGLMEAEAGLGK